MFVSLLPDGCVLAGSGRASETAGTTYEQGPTTEPQYEGTRQSDQRY